MTSPHRLHAFKSTPRILSRIKSFSRTDNRSIEFVRRNQNRKQQRIYRNAVIFSYKEDLIYVIHEKGRHHHCFVDTLLLHLVIKKQGIKISFHVAAITQVLHIKVQNVKRETIPRTTFQTLHTDAIRNSKRNTELLFLVGIKEEL